MDSVAPQHVESPQPRDGTLVPCIGRQVLNYWTTWEVPKALVITRISSLADWIQGSKFMPVSYTGSCDKADSEQVSLGWGP